MKTVQNTAAIVKSYIQEIWNERNFKKLNEYLHPDFVDNSLSLPFPPNREGLEGWIKATGMAFEHSTTITHQVSDEDSSIVRIRMDLKHIGTWRNFSATGKAIFTVGYRHFRIKDGKIAEHWALIDPNKIEKGLKD